MNFEKVKRIHLIGIGGTAMGSLAGLLKEKGYEVTGSDANVYPPMDAQLQELGMQFFSGYDPKNLESAQPDIVIPGNAIPRGNPELEALLNLGLPYLSLAEVVKEFFLRNKHSIVIAGTHGKTTTASMAAWLLESAKLDPSFLVGGIPVNFGRSFQWKEAGKYFVIEGDEYDTGFMDRRPKFVSYLPQTIVLNAVEYDHADVYPDLASVENAFWQLVKILPAKDLIIVSRDSDIAYRLARRGYSRVISCGYNPDSDYHIEGESWKTGTAQFFLNGRKHQIPTIGKHNLANAAAVAILGKELGIPDEQIRSALQTFQGVKRRMELRGEVNGISIYDDFAHHPTAIDKTLEGARLAFPQSRIWGLFEPRSWSSRRNIFQAEFARSFGRADIAIIAAVFEPDKLSADVRLNPEMLAREILKNGTKAHYIPEQQKLINFVLGEAKPGDKLVLMSNGSFDGLHDKLLEALRKDHGEKDSDKQP